MFLCYVDVVEWSVKDTADCPIEISMRLGENALDETNLNLKYNSSTVQNCQGQIIPFVC